MEGLAPQQVFFHVSVVVLDGMLVGDRIVVRNLALVLRLLLVLVKPLDKDRLAHELLALCDIGLVVLQLAGGHLTEARARSEARPSRSREKKEWVSRR
jgi:hypothetical protein